MIPDVDAAISAMLLGEALAGSGVDVVLDAPTTDWAARRSGPVVNAFLYDIREDVERRNAHAVAERGPEGRIVGVRPGSRFFRLSYLVTAWTNRPEDEHRLLGLVLEALVRHDRVPTEHLGGMVEGETLPMTTALPPGEDRSLTDLWSALGGEMKPSVDLVVVAPLTPRVSIPVGPPVSDLRVDLGGR